jgi:hypothetical protein
VWPWPYELPGLITAGCPFIVGIGIANPVGGLAELYTFAFGVWFALATAFAGPVGVLVPERPGLVAGGPWAHDVGLEFVPPWPVGPALNVALLSSDGAGCFSSFQLSLRYGCGDWAVLSRDSGGRWWPPDGPE